MVIYVQTFQPENNHGKRTHYFVEVMMSSVLFIQIASGVQKTPYILFPVPYNFADNECVISGLGALNFRNASALQLQQIKLLYERLALDIQLQSKALFSKISKIFKAWWKLCGQCSVQTGTYFKSYFTPSTLLIFERCLTGFLYESIIILQKNLKNHFHKSSPFISVYTQK